MKCIIWFTSLAIMLVSLSASRVEACGDKLLVTGSAPGLLQIQGLDRAGVILFYRHGDSEVASSVLTEKLEKSLRNRGHRVEVADTPDELVMDLKTGQYDVVLADVKDVEALHDTSAKVVPVVFNAPYTEVASLKKSYGEVLEGPNKTSRYVKVITEALKGR